jgi:MFS family permease
MKTTSFALFLLIGFGCCSASAEAFAPSRRLVVPTTTSTTTTASVERRKSTTDAAAASLHVEPPASQIIQTVVHAVLPTSSKDAVVTTAETKKATSWFQSIDGIVYCSYLCNVMALSLPVLLVPIAATDHVVVSGGTTVASAALKMASMVAGISSIATLGGAVGKFTNGFICQAFGSYACSKLYFAGLAVCSLVFSLAGNAQTMGLAYAGMEFFASIQWAALAVMLSNYYSKAPVKLAAALTALGLSSTSGQIAAKTVGMTLASTLHWRVVAQIGAATALAGGLLIARAPQPDVAPTPEAPLSVQSIGASLKAILGSPLFWMLALAHSMAFVARGTDRILGTFFQHMADLPQAVSGGLTLSITLGLVHGLVTGSKQFTALTDVASKKRFLAKRYAVSVAAALGLTATAHYGPAFVSSKFLLTAVIGMLSGAMASNVAFQYFQFPAMIAKSRFAEHKAIVISFLDGFGFLLSAPIFAATGKIVPALGWSSAWGMLAALFGAGAVLMLSTIQPVLEKSD